MGVAALHTMVHIPREEHVGLLGRIAAWLRPGGILVATMGVHAVGGVYGDLLGVPLYWSSFDLLTNRRLVETAGLEIVSAEEKLEVEFARWQPFSGSWHASLLGDRRVRSL